MATIKKEQKNMKLKHGKLKMIVESNVPNSQEDPWESQMKASKEEILAYVIQSFDDFVHETDKVTSAERALYEYYIWFKKHPNDVEFIKNELKKYIINQKI